MSTTVTNSKADRAEPLACPMSGFPGERVEWLTVAALTAGPISPQQGFWLCRDPLCDTVYFGSAGALVSRTELNVEPGFKAASTGLVCYCFKHRRDEIARELAASGHTLIIDALRAKMRAGQCACKVRNPSGKCCLGEVQQAVQELLSRLGIELEEVPGHHCSRGGLSVLEENPSGDSSPSTCAPKVRCSPDPTTNAGLANEEQIL